MLPSPLAPLAPFADSPAVHSDDEGVPLQLHVQPGARSTGVVGPHGDRLSLVRGASSRQKTVRVRW